MIKKKHDLGYFQHGNAPYPRHALSQREYTLNDAVPHSSMQVLVYQIHQEKGRDALDNWLKSERIFGDIQ